MSRSLKSINVECDNELVSVSRNEGFEVWHLYPTLADWPAGVVSDNINPRSHNENVLDSPVAEAIRKTATETPDKFVLANRGLLVLANEVVKGTTRGEPGNPSIAFKIDFSGNSAVRGLADGGTTDAALASITKRSKNGRVHVEVVVGLNDPDLVAVLVEGRNTSRQVRQSSLVNASGRFDWLKAALPPEMRDRIAWEENATNAVASVGDVLGLLGMFRPGCGQPLLYTEEGYEGDRQNQREWAQKAQASYRDRSKLAATLRDDAVLEDFKATATIAADLLRLHDVVYAGIAEVAEEGVKKTKSAAKEVLWDAVAKPAKGHSTPFTNQPVTRKVSAGWTFPAVAGARQFLKDGKWTVNPEMFFPLVVQHAREQAKMVGFESKLSAEKHAKSAFAFEHAVIGVRLEQKGE